MDGPLEDALQGTGALVTLFAFFFLGFAAVQRWRGEHFGEADKQALAIAGMIAGAFLFSLFVVVAPML